jgi:hypothetical protein
LYLNQEKKYQTIGSGILSFVCAILLAAGLGCSSRYLTLHERLRLHDEEIDRSNKNGCIAGCVLFEGDSNMELINFQEYFSRPCCNYSRRGSTTEDLLKRMDEINSIKPDTIVMLVGGNDLLQHIPIGAIDKKNLLHQQSSRAIQFLSEKSGHQKFKQCPPKGMQH